MARELLQTKSSKRKTSKLPWICCLDKEHVMKKVTKKLALTKEIVRSLAETQLMHIAGGISRVTLCGSICNDCTGPASGGVTCQTSQDSNCGSFGNSCVEGGC